jgi:prepilin-type N-terminal cleavage/methylation domain-containing protein
MTSVRRRLSAAAREEGGFTLSELLVVLAILGTVVGAIMTLFSSALKSEVDLTQRVRAQEEARMALNTLRRDVHCASATSGLTEGVPSNVVTFLLPSGCPSATTETITWCTRTTGVADRHTLYRVPGADCAAAGGADYADHITEPVVFLYTKEAGLRARIDVEFSVDVDPATSSRQYKLRDALVLRNSAR